VITSEINVKPLDTCVILADINAILSDTSVIPLNIIVDLNVVIRISM
jgi:hypothetical protein